VVEVVFRRRARADLNAILAYLNERSPVAAESYISTVRTACLGLGDFPEKAVRYDDRYRVLFVRNHAVFYRYERESQRIVIVSILDSRRDIDALMRALGRHTTFDPH